MANNDDNKTKLAKRVHTGVIKIKNSAVHRYGTIAAAAGLGIHSGLKAKTLVGKALRGFGVYALSSLGLTFGQGYVLGRNHDKPATWENGVGQKLEATEYEAAVIDNTQKTITKLFNKIAKAKTKEKEQSYKVEIAQTLANTFALTQDVKITDAGIYGASKDVVDYAKPVNKGGIERFEILDTRKFLLDAQIKGF